MKVLIIMPYFLKKGKQFPEWFQLFLNSCGYNNQFNWLLITNSVKKYNYPKNVLYKHMEFSELKEYVQKKFDFPISLEREYKLCDYKPLYGHIFKEMLEGYDFWGYCDCADLIFGDLSRFITNDILEKYHKIYWKGHLTLYKNEAATLQRLFQYSKQGKNYQSVLTDSNNYAMDEVGFINVTDAWKNESNLVYIHDEDIADIGCESYNFRLSMGVKEDGVTFWCEKSKNRIFEWAEGRLYSLYLKDGEIHRQEYAYVHFQKRDLEYTLSDRDGVRSYYIVPNKLCRIETEITPKMIRNLTRNHLFYKKWVEIKWAAVKARIKRLKKFLLGKKETDR